MAKAPVAERTKPKADPAVPSPPEIQALVEARHADPFSVLGMHVKDNSVVVRALVPDAAELEVLDARSGKPVASLAKLHEAGLFCGAVPRRKNRFAYRLRASRDGHVWEFEDPYRFGPVLGEVDEYLIAEGTHETVYDRLGAHVMTHEGVDGANRPTGW